MVQAASASRVALPWRPLARAARPPVPTAGLGDVLRDPPGQQTRGKPLALTQRDRALDGIRGLGLPQRQELLARPGGVVHGGLPLKS
jgi:hypothetical protein